MTNFEGFPKIARLSRECVITEKIDGTNASVLIPEDGGPMLVGSRTRWITTADDNYGFARWAALNEEQLRTELGFGHHFGEWWGSGIQRGYGLKNGDKRFSLFNVHQWEAAPLSLCRVVPIIFRGLFSTAIVDTCIADLRHGSRAVPGYMKPEGVIVYHTAARMLFKKTLEKDEEPKSITKS